MATAIPNRIYVSGTHTAAVAVSLPTFTAPFPGITAQYVLTQDWMCEINSFAPLALNTAHPDYPDYKLTGESETRDMSGGMFRWTRTYAQLPESYSEPGGNYAYRFIGLMGGGGPVGEGGVIPFVLRNPLTLNVPVLITRDFFLVGTGGTVATFEAIPEIGAQRYFNVEWPVPNGDTDWLGRGEGFTVPTAEEYEEWIAADASSDSFHIVVESSSVSRWMGNFFMRETRRVKAK